MKRACISKRPRTFKAACRVSGANKTSRLPEMQMKQWRQVLLLLGIVCLAAIPIPALAQQQVGGLRVVVTDPSGSVIPGAEVEFHSAALIRPVFGTSDDLGLIINTNLPPGNYSVIVRSPGFQTAVNEEVVVQVGRNFLRHDGPRGWPHRKHDYRHGRATGDRYVQERVGIYSYR